MNRLLFEKRGDAVYLSHLDLMRVFQRAFKRAGILLWHSQGFSPRAYVSIALPLPVGMESRCEILDFEIEDGSVELSGLPARLNAVLPAGIRVLEAYESARKIKELTRLRAEVTLEYDSGVPKDAQKALAAFFCAREHRYHQAQQKRRQGTRHQAAHFRAFHCGSKRNRASAGVHSFRAEPGAEPAAAGGGH